MDKRYFRGDIYYADLGRGLGSEQQGLRPVLIIQNNTGNRYSPTVIVASITSKVKSKAEVPTHFPLNTNSGLRERSLVLLEQIRTIDKGRLTDFVGHLDDISMEKINSNIKLSLGINF